MPPGPQQAYGPQPAFYAPQYGARFGRRGFGPVQRNIPATILIVIGAIAIGGSVFLEWGTTALFDHSRNADQIPLEFLWNNTPGALDTFPLRWPMWLGAILMFGSAFNARAKAGAFVGGILAIATAALFVNAVRRVHADAALAIGGSSLSGIGIGPWLCLGGGLVGIVGAIISMRSSPRS